MKNKLNLPILVTNPFKRFERKIRGKSYIVPKYHEMKCIFVHIPKSAGTSVKKTLFGNERITHRLAMDYYLDSPKDFDAYFSFAFVRNPYDRVVSAYHYLMQGGKNEGDKKFRDKYLLEYKNFSDFVMRGLSKPEILKWWHFMHQFYFVVNNEGNIIVDYIGRFENINEDFEFVAQNLGLVKSLPNLNKSNRKEYEQFYTKELSDIVYSIYEKDFEYFGYDKI
jgi:hypothetical protein